eukprot:9821083-Heterocapsa_arctica.AAC.1
MALAQAQESSAGTRNFLTLQLHACWHTRRESVGNLFSKVRIWRMRRAGSPSILNSPLPRFPRCDTVTGRGLHSCLRFQMSPCPSIHVQ